MRQFDRALRELSKDVFESFVHQYLIAEYPGAGIKRVDGSGGDAGVDSFAGNLDLGAAIWQSKHFPNRVKGPQQVQIVKSVKTAFRNNAPTLWTLCLPIDLRTPEHKWFQQKVEDVYRGPEHIKLIQASDFATELQHNTALRDTFFPDNALSAMREVRKILTSTEEKTSEQLAVVANEYALQFLAKFAELDSRLQSVVSFGGAAKMRFAAPQTGHVMSIRSGERTTSFFARDVVAFNRDPLKLTIEMRAEHKSAMELAMDTGQSATVGPGSIVGLDTASPLLKALFESTDPAQLKVEIIPISPSETANKEIPLRIIAGSGTSAKELRYVPFRMTQAGQREVTPTSSGALPAKISLRLRLTEGGATCSISPLLPDADVQSLDQVLQVIEEVQRSGQFEIRSVAFDTPIVEQLGGDVQSSLLLTEGMRRIIADASIVARVFNKRLRLPSRIKKEEEAELHTLRMIATGEDFGPLSWTATLTKMKEYEKGVLD